MEIASAERRASLSGGERHDVWGLLQWTARFLDSLFKSSRGPKRALGIIGDGFIKLLKSFGMKHDLLHHSEVFLPKTGKDFFGRNADDFAITNFPHSTL